MIQHFTLTQIQEWFPPRENYHISENNIGHSESKVYIIEQNGVKKFVAKCQLSENDYPLQKNYDYLEWLNGRFNAPKVERYEVRDGYEWLIMTFVEGIPAYEFGQENEEEMGRVLGETLKEIHQTSPDKFPDPNHKLKPLIKNFRARAGNTYEPKDGWDLVFSHGDYCLPNVLIRDDLSVGLIDLGDIGVYDRYYDIYWALWSMKYNKVEKGIESFLKAYGIEELDQERLDFMEQLCWFADREEEKN